MDAKPAFDPSQPFEAVASKPPFDPSKPFEPAAPVATADPQADAAQGARDAAAIRVRGPVRPPTGRQPDPSWSDVGNVITQAATGANEGLSSTVLRAADAIPYLASKAMGGEGVHPLEGTFNDTFVKPVPQPSTDAQSIARAGGHMAGANLENFIPVAGLTNSGIRSGVTMAEQAAPGIVNKVRGAADAVMDWMRANPGKALTSDTLGAGQAGAGGEFGREVAQDAGASPGVQQAAEMAGQMFTPAAMAAYSKVGPGALAARTGTRLAKTAIENVPEGVLPERLQPAGGTLAERKAESLAYANREGKYANPEEPAPKEPNFVQRQMDAGTEARTQKATEVVGKQFNKITAEPEAAANLAETNKLKAEIPGFEPGIAKATGDPALLNKQQEFESKATGDELRQRQAATDTSRGAIREYMDNAVPPQGENPQDAVAKAAGIRVRSVEDRIGAQRAGVEGQIKAQSDSLPETDPSAVGTYLRDTRKSLKGEADAHMTELRKNVDPGNGTMVQVGEGEPMTVNAALDRRAQINQDLAAHYSATNRDVGAVKNIQALQAEKEALDGAINGVNAPGLKEYNDYYRDEYAPRFLQGASRDVGRFNRNGYEGNRLASEDVPGQFFKPNNVSEARQFNKLYGEDAGARQQMTDHALDDLRRVSVDPNTGLIKEGAVNKWLAKNERILNEMPWIREAVSAKNPDALYQRMGQLDRRQATVADTKVAGLLGKNPEQHVDAALNDWQVMKGLRSAVRGDPQSEAALTRAVWDRARAATGKDTLVDADGLQKWIDGHRRSLAQVLTPQHLNNLETVIKASRVEARLPRPAGTYEKTKNAFSDAEGVAGTTIPSLGATTSALARGRSSPVYEVPRLLLNFYRGMSEREANAIWKEALYNPKVANQITVAAKGGVATPMQLSRMHNYMLTVSEQDATKAEEGHK